MILSIFYQTLIFVCLIATLSAPTSAADYILDDEFNTPSLSASWMPLDVYDNKNNERQCYTPSQVSVHDGYLNISTITQRTQCSGTVQSFASGAVVWAPSLSFTYGTVEYRAKFAGGKGTWPAIWLLGDQCHPNSPYIYNAPDCHWPQPGSNEIDLTEIQRSNFIRPGQNVINPAGTWAVCRPTVTDVSQNFHTYKFTWTPTSLTWWIDGVQTCQQTDRSYIPNTPMYMIINTAMGGNGASRVNRATLPQTTQVDYIRVTPYQETH